MYRVVVLDASPVLGAAARIFSRVLAHHTQRGQLVTYKLKHQLEEYNGELIIPHKARVEFRGKYQSLPVDVPSAQAQEALWFSIQMTYGKEGAHRDHRQTSSHHRSLGEILANTLQGKLAEFAAYQGARNLGKEVSYPDLSVTGLGTWDSGDLEIDGENVSVKSAKHFSNALLLEVADWDDKGLYIPDNQRKPYDYFLFVRVQLSEELRNWHKFPFSHDATPKEIYKQLLPLLDPPVLCDIVGQLKHGIFRAHVIRNHQIVKQGANFHKRRMDVSNYYVLAADLWRYK